MQEAPIGRSINRDAMGLGKTHIIQSVIAYGDQMWSHRGVPEDFPDRWNRPQIVAVPSVMERDTLIEYDLKLGSRYKVWSFGRNKKQPYKGWAKENEPHSSHRYVRFNCSHNVKLIVMQRQLAVDRMQASYKKMAQAAKGAPSASQPVMELEHSTDIRHESEGAQRVFQAAFFHLTIPFSRSDTRPYN